jgi:flagellin
MIINHNLSAIFTNHRVKFNDRALAKSMEKISSGLRINRAGDDASGLAVSEKMRAQIRGLSRAEKKRGRWHLFYPSNRRLSTRKSGYSSQT